MGGLHESIIPGQISEPKNYYQGMDQLDRVLCRNVIVFERLSKATLQQRDLANRMHHRYVLMRVEQTSGIVSIDGKSVKLDVGEVLLVAPYQFHHYIQLEDESLHWIFITFELERGESQLLELSRRVLKFDEEMERAWREVISRWNQNERSTLVLMDLLLWQMNERAGVSKRFILSPSKDSWISKLEALVIQSVKAGWTLEEVAQRVGFSERHMRTRFEEYTGISLRDYRASYQFHVALSFMRDSESLVSEIAEHCGFQSSSAFSRFIRRMAGVTPKELRKLVKSGAYETTEGR